MSRLMRRGSAEGRAAKAGASTTKRWWPPLSRFATGSRARRKTSGRMAAMPVECDWPSPLTAAPIPCVALSRMPSRQARCSSPTIGAAMPAYASGATTTMQLPKAATPEIAEQFMPMIHLVFSNLKTWLNGIHHGVSAKHLQAYLNEFTFRFNRRFYPFNAFRSLLGVAGGVEAPTYADLYSGVWTHPTSS